MTHPQISRTARRARHKERLRGAAPVRPLEDPQLGRMLISHVHCGEPMQLLIVDRPLLDEGFGVRNDGVLHTYRCACGFSFDQRPA